MQAPLIVFNVYAVVSRDVVCFYTYKKIIYFPDE